MLIEDEPDLVTSQCSYALALDYLVAYEFIFGIDISVSQVPTINHFAPL